MGIISTGWGGGLAVITHCLARTARERFVRRGEFTFDERELGAHVDLLLARRLHTVYTTLAIAPLVPFPGADHTGDDGGGNGFVNASGQGTSAIFLLKRGARARRP